MRFLFGISIFRRIFLGSNRKTRYLCNRKNKVRGFKPIEWKEKEIKKKKKYKYKYK